MMFLLPSFMHIRLTVAPLQVSSRRSSSLMLTATLFPLHLVSFDLRQRSESYLTKNNTDTPAKPKAAPKGKKSAPASTPSKKRTKKVDGGDAEDDDEDEGRTLLRKKSRLIKAEDSDDE
jgi:hypothetical protein